MARQDVQPIWVDDFFAYTRNDTSVATVVMLSARPEVDKMVEVMRMVTSTKQLKKLTDMLCEHLDYYPSPPDDRGHRGKAS